MPSLAPRIDTLETTPSFSGAASFADGSAAAPLLRFTLDTTTGLYRIGTSNIGFTTGGVKSGSINSGAWQLGPDAAQAVAHFASGVLSVGHFTASLSQSTPTSINITNNTSASGFFYNKQYTSGGGTTPRVAYAFNANANIWGIGTNANSDFVFGVVSYGLGTMTNITYMNQSGGWVLGRQIGDTAPTLPFIPFAIQTPVSTTAIGLNKVIKYSSGTTAVDLVTITSASWDSGHNLSIYVEAFNISTGLYSRTKGHAQSIGASATNTIQLAATDINNNGLGLGSFAWSAGTGVAILRYTPPTNTDNTVYEITINNRKFPYTLP